MMSIFQPLMAMSMHEYIHPMHDPNLVDLSRVCHIPLKYEKFTQLCWQYLAYPCCGLMCQIVAAYRKHPQIELHPELLLM
jgi:hypothetical protein